MTKISKLLADGKSHKDVVIFCHWSTKNLAVYQPIHLIDFRPTVGWVNAITVLPADKTNGFKMLVGSCHFGSLRILVSNSASFHVALGVWLSIYCLLHVHVAV